VVPEAEPHRQAKARPPVNETRLYPRPTLVFAPSATWKPSRAISTSANRSRSVIAVTCLG
jgi:hypothetical protein